MRSLFLSISCFKLRVAETVCDEKMKYRFLEVRNVALRKFAKLSSIDLSIFNSSISKKRGVFPIQARKSAFDDRENANPFRPSENISLDYGSNEESTLYVLVPPSKLLCLEEY